MLASKLYSPTLREIPSDAVVVSHQYMLKAGMMRKVSNGLYAFLPLALRSQSGRHCPGRNECDREPGNSHADYPAR